VLLQWLVSQHGPEILDAIRRHSTDLSLPLDNIESQPSTVPRPKVDGQAVDQTRISPAKEEAWRMWQEQGLSFFAIAVCVASIITLLS
jgi:ATP-dependent DNA helicase RecQ